MSETSDNKKDAKRRKTSSGLKYASESVITDARFANIQSDPRYRLPSRRHTHVKLDKRFAHMLRDAEFSRNAAVDRYGRKLRRDDTKKQLERFYRLDEDEEEKDEEDEENISIDDDDEVQRELQRVEKAGYDPARDGGFSSSSSESSSEESDEEEEDEVEELQFPAEERDNVPVGEVTNRIAVVNLDWDHIRAEDLMAVFTSFLPTGGRLLKVSIYPSEFGRERMEREDMEGPPQELFAKKKAKGEDYDSAEGEDEEEEEEKIKQSILKEDTGEDFDSTQLRKYQLERLRYFYAILTFSSKEVAKHVYDAVDGAEYMSSANFFDLRFVPDETDFSEDTPRDECEKIPDGYRPNDFVTDALRHSKVKLTWDMDDATRKEAQARAFKAGRKEIDENDLKAYLGSDSSEDEEDEAKKEAERQRLRSLLGLSDKPLTKPKDKAPVGEMEVTFSAGLSAAPAREGGVFENEPEKEETTRERYIRKERERRARRKAKLKALKKGEVVDDEKAKDDTEKQDEDKEDLGFNDPFFAAPENDAKAAAKKRKEEKRKLREEREKEEAASAAQRAELELLMVDDKATGIKHFDMKEIEKAEKRAKKKSKKGKNAGADAPVDDFKMDVQDPRFQRLFENHEFAIDPTNPRFKNTRGMKALLEEGRKRRRQKENEEPTGEAARSVKKKKPTEDWAAESEDLVKLVERVKGKVKK
ncbi:hypothetical protein VTO42DRAFT_8814 [Malbranchea cinnamomea]